MHTDVLSRLLKMAASSLTSSQLCPSFSLSSEKKRKRPSPWNRRVLEGHEPRCSPIYQFSKNDHVCLRQKTRGWRTECDLTNEGKKRKCIGKLSSRFRWKGCFRNCRRWPLGPRQRLQSLLLPFVSPIIARSAEYSSWHALDRFQSGRT